MANVLAVTNVLNLSDEFAVGSFLLLAVIAVFWVFQFSQLMMLSEADFPGRYDKPLWVAAFFFAFVVAPFAFIIWKSATRAMRKMQRVEPPVRHNAG